MRSHNDEVSPMGSNDDEGNRTHRNEVIQSTTKHCEGGHHYESWENVANTVGGERRRALRSCVENVSEICHVRYIEAEVDRKGDTSYEMAGQKGSRPLMAWSNFLGGKKAFGPRAGSLTVSNLESMELRGTLSPFG